ncbi:MAG TPA: ATP synthase F1 subunit gamma [Blastocatellia bacterium]|nr:ATP synthase F1 subunit gamma [Blastocatellia bacterium]
MPNLQDMRRRVRSVKNMRQITKAMKMVSAAKLRRAQERVTSTRPYTNKMTQILGGVARRAPDFRHPLLASSEVAAEGAGRERVLLALVTADKGLCGAFNTNLVKAAQEFLRTNTDKQVELVTIGRKGAEVFRRRPVTVRREHLGVTGTSRVSFFEAADIARKLIADFTAEEGGFDRVYLIYNEFKSALQQKVVVEPVLPIGKIEGEGEAAEQSTLDYLYEQPPAEIYNILLPKLIEAQVYRALLESVASEQGARMTAMDSASKNASEMIDRLTLTMNRIRQAAITREIIEVVSGAEAL